MKRLTINIILLAVSVILLILVYPINRRAIFQQLNTDCSNRSVWVYDRIVENTKPIDIAFLGSSHTMNGINDKLIEEKLNTNVVNLGYCRFGENLIYVFLKEIVKAKNVKTIIIEVREDEDRYSHPIFPYIAETRDVFLATPLFNREILNNYYRHLYYRLEVIKNTIFKNLENENINIDDFGFTPSYDTASIKVLNEAKEKRQIQNTELTQFERDFHMKFARTYLERMYKICKQKNIKMYFLYLPSYESNVQIPKEYDTYNKYGKVIIPPKEIFQKPSNWFDENHLNRTGADALSMWIANKLINF